MSADIQSLVASLQDALGIRIACGQITLNMNDGRIESVETKTKQRVPKAKRDSDAHAHDFYYDMGFQVMRCRCGALQELTKSAT